MNRRDVLKSGIGSRLITTEEAADRLAIRELR
jgi:hypothetical protein